MVVSELVPVPVPVPVLEIQNLSKSFGAVKACDDVCLSLLPGQIHALIGPNGAGKSTLIQQIAGVLRPDSGTVVFMGKDVTALDTVRRSRMGLGRSFQVTAVISNYSVMDNILLALHGREGRGFSLFSNARKVGVLRDEAYDYANRTNLHSRLEVRACELAHGERRRLELAMVLALKPRAFLLDEPMAGLGNEGAEELTELLAQLKVDAPVLLIEHDMDVVFALADTLSVLVSGRVIATGTVDVIRANPSVREAYLGDEEVGV